jgi:hypothetical protein
MMRAYRHGDLLIIEAAIPTTTTTVQPTNGRHVLAEGEATGHHHTIQATPDTRLVTAGEANELRMWLSLTAPAELTHQEHATIVIPPGDYEVIRQQEYVPEGLRQVAD